MAARPLVQTALATSVELSSQLSRFLAIKPVPLRENLHVQPASPALVTQVETIGQWISHTRQQIEIPEKVIEFDDQVRSLETWIDDMEEKLPPLKNFILPGGGLAASLLHVCRSVTRRTERRIVPLIRETPTLVSTGRFYNRLSDYFFVAARTAAMQAGEPEIVYRKL